MAASAPSAAATAARPVADPALEADLRLFIGPRADAYLAYFRGRYRDPGQSLDLSWHWGAALFPIPWMFYRKLYVLGFGLLLLPVVAGALLPHKAGVSLGGLSLALFCGLLARRVYLDHAIRCIRRTDAAGLAPAERGARIRRTGGVSWLGAGLATALWFGLAALPFVL